MTFSSLPATLLDLALRGWHPLPPSRTPLCPLSSRIPSFGASLSFLKARFSSSAFLCTFPPTVMHQGPSLYTQTHTHTYPTPQHTKHLSVKMNLSSQMPPIFLGFNYLFNVQCLGLRQCQGIKMVHVAPNSFAPRGCPYNINLLLYCDQKLSSLIPQAPRPTSIAAVKPYTQCYQL